MFLFCFLVLCYDDRRIKERSGQYIQSPAVSPTSKRAQLSLGLWIRIAGMENELSLQAESGRLR